MSPSVPAASVVSVMAIALLLGGCTAPQADDAPSVSPTPSEAAPTSLQVWDEARAFLAAQTAPVEVTCLSTVQVDGAWILDEGGMVTFFSLDADQDEWKPFLLYRDDPRYLENGTACAINVPTSVPYDTAGIEGFLNPLGFSFNGTEGLQRVEISYAGATPNDPDFTYAATPGLYGLRIALQPLGTGVIEPGTAEIAPPTTDEQADLYLSQAGSLLEWYGFEDSAATDD